MFDNTRPRIATIALGFTWTLVLVASLWWNHVGMTRQIRENAKSQAAAHFERDQALRNWGAKHGGLYVPVTDRTRPNTALDHLGNRDFVGPDGRLFTLMNPPYMIRQINDDISESAGVQARAVSRKPLRPENMAKGWELEALTRFADGTTEVMQTTEEETGSTTLHFMRPLVMAETCLKCHENSNARPGEVSGGIAVSIPMTQFEKAKTARWIMVLGTHFLVWFLGLGGLFFAVRLLVREGTKRETIARDLQEVSAMTEKILDSLPVGVVLVGHDKVIRKINKTALGILQKEEGEVVGLICHQHLCPIQKGQCPILDLNTELDSSERIILGAEGREIPIIKSVIPFVYQGEKVLLEAFVDISERKETIARITQSMDDLQRFNRLAVDRELRMVELKSEINGLLEEKGNIPRYKVAEVPSRGGSG